MTKVKIQNITREEMVNLIDDVPLPLLGQFYKIACYYFGYTHAAPMEKSKLRSAYINGVKSAEMMINIIDTLSSNGESFITQSDMSKDFIIQLNVAKAFLQNGTDKLGDDKEILPIELSDNDELGSEDIPEVKEESEQKEKKTKKRKSKVQKVLEKKLKGGSSNE